jgi:hypothetical protein
MTSRRGRKRSDNIPREPPPEVKKILRQEVHYACPVPECGRPLLMWHHFDPRWEEKHHHDSDGMIALCTLCHPRADRGTWTKEQLKSFKQNPAPLGLIREQFGWSERSVLYRLGGNYSVDCKVALVLGGQPILWNERSAEGRLLFSLDFFGERRERLLQVSENCLSVDASKIWDLKLNTGATHLKLWLGERKPGIELQFRRLSLEQLRKIIKKDVEDSGDLLEYVSSNCLDSDGNVTHIDVAQARFHAPTGSLVQVTDSGVLSSDGNRWVGCVAVDCYGGFSL